MLHCGNDRDVGTANMVIGSIAERTDSLPAVEQVFKDTAVMVKSGTNLAGLAIH
jgi:hypothetical protein